MFQNIRGRGGEQSEVSWTSALQSPFSLKAHVFSSHHPYFTNLEMLQNQELVFYFLLQKYFSLVIILNVIDTFSFLPPFLPSFPFFFLLNWL